MAEIRVPPHNTEAERAVLGAVLIDTEALDKVVDVLEPDFFYDPKHALLYENMFALHKEGSPVDVLTLTSQLKKVKKLRQSGGSVYISEIITSVPTSANVRNYALLVREMAVRRKLITFGAKLDEQAREEKDSLEDILDVLEQNILSLSRDSTQKDFFNAEELIELQLQKADEYARDPDGLRGISTGLNSLDNLLHGFHDSDLIILAARPSVGKSALAFHFARHAAVHEQKSVLVFALEMPAVQVIERMLAQQMQANLWNIRMGRMTPEENKRYPEGAGRIAESKLIIDETPGVSIMQLRSKARKVMMEQGLDMIIIDYLQLMQTRDTDNRAQAIGEISRSLKILARELQVPIICLSQLNRAVENRGDRIPQLSDLRESGSIEQDADVVMFISRELSIDEIEDDMETYGVEVFVAKHRNGSVGKCKFEFNFRQQRYIE